MERVTAPALRRGLSICELLAQEDQGLRIPEITARLDLPRASTHELVNTLADLGYVSVEKDTGKVSLGVAVMRLAAGYQRTLDLAAVGRECASEVASRCGETVQLVVRDGSFVVFVVRVDTKHMVRLVSQVGSRLPATCTAGGKMLLSQLETEELGALIPDDEHLTVMTSRSITTRKALDKDLSTVRRRGWASEYSESSEGITCVAAPVYNQHDECVAAMSISVPVMRWKREDQPRFVAWVQEGAAEMSRRLGSPAHT